MDVNRQPLSIETNGCFGNLWEKSLIDFTTTIEVAQDGYRCVSAQIPTNIQYSTVLPHRVAPDIIIQ